MSYGSYFAQVAREAGLAKAPEEALSRPHHITNSSGKIAGFKNIYESWGKGVSPVRLMSSFLKLALKGELNSPDTKNPPISIRKPDFLPSRFTKNLRATWLGHACYYVEFPSGLRVLFDPVFEDRCSPFSMLGPKRYTPRPCDLADIPVVDAVVISHSHYDHLSHSSVQELQKYHPRAQFFVGLGLEKWFRASGITNVTEMDWWENAQLKLVRQNDGSGPADAPETIEVTISCLPCQHTSARTLWDKDTTLWCSWAVTSNNKSVWFGGDTGYRAVPYYPPTIDDYAANPDLPKCPQFKQIGDLRGPFNLGLIPIGAYSPRVAFSPMHANPFDAVEIYKDIKCQRGMGIHWGTWALTTEDVMEPPALLKKALEASGLEQSMAFDTCAIGESREFPDQ